MIFTPLPGISLMFSPFRISAYPKKHAWLAGRAVLGALVSTKTFSYDVFHIFFVLNFLYVYTAYT